MFNTSGLILSCRKKYLVIICNSNSEKWKDQCNSKWNFPKGKFDPSIDSNYIDTAIREVKMKTGLNVEKEWIIDTFKTAKSVFYHVDPSKIPQNFYKNLNCEDESLDIFYKWVSIDEMKKIPEDEISTTLKYFLKNKN